MYWRVRVYEGRYYVDNNDGTMVPFNHRKLADYVCSHLNVNNVGGREFAFDSLVLIACSNFSD